MGLSPLDFNRLPDPVVALALGSAESYQRPVLADNGLACANRDVVAAK